MHTFEQKTKEVKIKKLECNCRNSKSTQNLNYKWLTPTDLTQKWVSWADSSSVVETSKADESGNRSAEEAPSYGLGNLGVMESIIQIPLFSVLCPQGMQENLKVNLSSRQLSNKELSLLQLDLYFVPMPMPKYNTFQTHIDLYKLFRNIKLIFGGRIRFSINWEVSP